MTFTDQKRQNYLINDGLSNHFLSPSYRFNAISNVMKRSQEKELSESEVYKIVLQNFQTFGRHLNWLGHNSQNIL